MKRLLSAALILLVMAGVTRAEKPGEWIDLLAKDSMSAWRPYDAQGSLRNWHLKDGVLHLSEKSGDLITRQQFEDFELRLEWKIKAEGNSGVLYRVRTGDKKPWHSGPEYQIIDNALLKGDKKTSQATGALYDLVSPAKSKLNPPGEWNSSRIKWQKNVIEHWLNGTRVVSIDATKDEWKALVADSKFAKHNQFAAGSKGHICLQDHRHETWFRKIRIRRLGD